MNLETHLFRVDATLPLDTYPWVAVINAEQPQHHQDSNDLSQSTSTVLIT